MVSSINEKRGYLVKDFKPTTQEVLVKDTAI